MSFFLDGFASFDEETAVASRRPRPYRLSFADVCAAFVDSGAPFNPPIAAVIDTSDPLAAPWLSLESDVLEAVSDLRAGRYTNVLSRAGSGVDSASSFGSLLSAVSSDEWPSPAPSDFATPETTAAAGGPPSLGDAPFITGLFAKRASRFVTHAEGDEYFIDGVGVGSAPARWRALLVGAVAAAALSLFDQSNVTGPELLPAAIAGVHPAPWAASLLPAGEVAAAEKAAGEAAARDAIEAEAAWTRSQWQRDRVKAMAEENEDGNGNGNGTNPLEGDSGEAVAPAAALIINQDEIGLTAAPRLIGPLTKYSLLSLSPPGDDEVYALLPHPHFLATARYLLSGLVRPVEGGSTAVASAAAAEARAGATPDPRISALHSITDDVGVLHWLAARAALAHAHALLEREPHRLVWLEVAAYFRRAALSLCPDVSVAFTERDVFRRRLVATQLRESGAPDREMGDLAIAGDDAQETAAIAAIAGPARARPLVARLLLEWGLAQHALKRAAGAKTSFFLAKRETGLLTCLSGASGKRTKFQRFNTIQLVLNAASTGAQADFAVLEATVAKERAIAAGRFTSSSAVAKEGQVDALAVAAAAAVAVVDPVTGQVAPSFVLGGVREVKHSDVDNTTELLETVEIVAGAGTEAERAARHELFYAKGWGQSLEFPASASATSASTTTPAVPPLSNSPISTLDQCVVLALCLDVSNHNPADGLTNEEMRPYAARVMDTPLNWHVHSTALYVRALLEFENPRTMDRAALQLQALADQYTTRLTATQSKQASIDGAAPAEQRLAYAPLVAFPARWELQRLIADKYRRLGAVRSALAVYEELELWEEVVECLALLERPLRAERLLRDLLARSPSPRLFCLLGAITDTDEPYVSAWEVSGRRYAKAAFALGRRAVEKGHFEAAAEHLRVGIRLAPHDEAAHFLAGILAMRFERWSEALTYFSRVVQCDPNRADAWSNIAAIHCHTEKWDPAYAAVTEALKQDRQDWRLLNNAVLAAVRSKHYSRSLSLQIQLVNFRLNRPPGLEGDEGGGGLDMALLAQVIDVILASGEEERLLELAAPAAATTAAAAAALVPPVETFPCKPLSLDFAEDDSDAANTDVLSLPTPPAPAPAPAPARIHIDSIGNPAILYLANSIATLRKIVSLVTPPPAVWLLLANLLFESGDEAGALDALLRHCRALMSVIGWANGEAAARSRVIAASARFASLAKPADARAHALYVCERLDAAAAAGSLSSEAIAAEGVDVARLRIIAQGGV